MAEPFLAEIRIFAGNFAPRGWSFCNGSLLPINQNTALFSLIGTIYGGDGRSTTALPNLQARAPMHPGTGPGLARRNLGNKGGASAAKLTVTQLPSHNHTTGVIQSDAYNDDSSNQTTYANSAPGNAYHANDTGATHMASQTLANYGGGQPHNNLQPFLAMHFIIAMTGTFPSRS